MVLDNEKFHKLLTRICDQTEYVDDNKQVDTTLASKGIIVTYHNKQYKKKVKLTINPNVILDGDKYDSNRLISKLEKRVLEYFDSKYQLDDFNLTEMVLVADINVGNREKVSAYLKVIQRIGRVKGFSPSNYEYIDGTTGFCLEGNSNGITFMTYDLESLLKNRLEKSKRKKSKTTVENSEGILRVEVRLAEPKAIRTYTDKTRTSKQIEFLSEKSSDIFLDTFMRIVPFGDFHKKDKAVEIIQREVKDMSLRRRMLWLLALIPEKKSLLLAQKAMNYRRIDDVMEAFAAIDLSPVTLSKRHDVKHLKNLYTYL